jgi:hypothetical protein
MANTGYIINNTVRQNFTTGPNSGSAVTGSAFDVDLTVAPFSASLDGTDYYNRAYEPDLCEPGFETCVVPLLTSLTTGSRRGRFAINYVTQSSFNPPVDITASISNNPDFSVSESFYASIDGIIPITSSFVSGTVYLRAFTSCSGPDPSPNSSPLAFTYDLLPPPLAAGSVNIVFKNNYSSTMEVDIRSLRGNANYRIAPGQSITYDYSTSPDPGAWTATGKSADLNVTIKGGARSAYGNYIQRSTIGIERETYTTGGGFGSPTSRTNNSSTFVADSGLNFIIRQLALPKNGTTTTSTFTLLQNTPPPPPTPPTPPPAPDPGPGPAPDYTPRPTSVFGSVPYATETDACGASSVNFREKQYYQLGNVLYDNLTDAQSGTRSVFPFTQNYILTDLTTFLIINKDGRLQSRGGCRLAQVTIETLRGNYNTQEEACSRQKTNSAANTVYEYKDNRLVNRVSGYTASTNLSGRYPLYEGVDGRGGRNIILSSGKIIGYETCGTELTDVTYGAIGWPNSSYPLGDPENGNPRNIQLACNNNNLITYSLGPSGVVYYGFNYKEGKYKYVPLGLGTRWYKTTDGTFINFDRGLVVDTADPC